MPAGWREQRVPHRLPVVMRVHIDPAGRDKETRGIDLASRRSCLAANGGNPSVRNRYVAGECRLTGAIDDGAAANDDLVHQGRSLDRKSNDYPPALGRSNSHWPTSGLMLDALIIRHHY